MFGECHAHIFMDAKNYKAAVALHKEGVKEQVIHDHFAMYKEKNITFVRDGGDALMVSERAGKIAPEYGIDYRTPVFAIHKNGHYGGIVGLGFDNLKEYHQLVLKAKAMGADFIKIMTTGLLDFADHGKITGQPLEEAEVFEMVHIAHEEGMAVMSHTNGVYGCRCAILAGVDSMEHGNFMDEDTIDLLANSDTVWVPTTVTVFNLLHSGRFPDQTILSIMDTINHNLNIAYDKKAHVALGSDAGAYLVPHGQGLFDEYHVFQQVLGPSKELDDWLTQGENLIKERFHQ